MQKHTKVWNKNINMNKIKKDPDYIVSYLNLSEDCFSPLRLRRKFLSRVFLWHQVQVIIVSLREISQLSGDLWMSVLFSEASTGMPWLCYFHWLNTTFEDQLFRTCWKKKKKSILFTI